MPSEKDVQRAIVEALVWDGWLILRINQGGMERRTRVNSETGYELPPRYIRFAYWQALGIDQQASGISDVIAVKARPVLVLTDGTEFALMLLAIECKAPGKKAKVTDKQQAFLDAIEEHGGIAVVADSLEDIEPYLDRAKAQ